MKGYTIVDLPSNHATNILSNITQNTIDFIGTHKFNSMYILVHFPQVRVTNEHDRFVDITNLWAKVCICSNGSMRGNFSLNRSSYPLLHFNSGYMHSHVSGIPKDDFTMFQVPCFGSGPVRDTMTSHDRVSVIEVMGRNAGWLTAAAQLAPTTSVKLTGR